MRDLPYSISIPDWYTLFVHAGIVPSLPLHLQERTNLVTMRNLLKVSSGDGPEVDVATTRIDIGTPWVDSWTGSINAPAGPPSTAPGDTRQPQQSQQSPWHIYFGHDARRGLQTAAFATGLDTGCVYGKKLTGIILPEKRLIEVPARAAYAPVAD